MDPLTVLRDYTVRGELDKIARSGDEFRFGGNEYSFPCTSETAYRSKQGNLYTLETLVFFLNHHHLKHTEYLQIARTHRTPSVTLPDRKPLLDYLHGRSASADAIELHYHPPPLLLDDPHPHPPKLHDQRLSAAAVAVAAASAAAVAASDIDHNNGNNNKNNSNDNGSRVGEGLVLDYVGMIRALERPLKDREALLECKHRDFYSVLVASTKREEERQRMESHQRKDGLELGFGFGFGFEGGAAKAKMHFKGSKIGEGVPIILVPSAFQTLITIYNVKEFLEDGVFIPTDVKVKQMKGAKPDCVTVQKKFSRDRVVTAYEVRDKPSALKAEDWDRVVSVFVLGKEWQFKDWPFKDHVEIFNKIIGFYMRFEDDSLESAKTVKQWNVKIISISKNKRHQDRAAALEVWDKLEEFVRSRSHN
ncbi:hypothetical protein Sjap_007989 [Stephania japonica]|uniref:PHP n=1 Tax=Stephania japonica TaxID=461633 RepID=A0AAP0PE65_9MAGN